MATVILRPIQQPQEESFEQKLARLKARRALRRRALRETPIVYATVEMPTFVQDDGAAAARRWAEALRKREAKPVTVPEAVINENRLIALLTQVKLRKITENPLLAQLRGVTLKPLEPEAVPEPVVAPVEEVPEQPEVPTFADILRRGIAEQPIPEPEVQPEPVVAPMVVAPVVEEVAPVVEEEVTRPRPKKKKKRKQVPAFTIEEQIEAPPDVAVEPIDVAVPRVRTRAQVRRERRKKTRDQVAVEQTNANVLPTAERLFTEDTQHDIEDGPTLEQAAENPMLWKEWLADKGLEVGEVLAAWSATATMTSGMVAIAGACATPFIGSLFVPVIASALLAPVARKVTGTGVNALTGFLRQKIGVRRVAQVNPPSHQAPSSEERAQVRSAARKMGSFMWNNMASAAGAVGLAGSAGQVASAALGIVNHATSPVVVAEAAKLGLTLATDGVWGVPWWAMKAAYNVGTSPIGVTIAARFVQQKLGWDKIGGEVGTYVQNWMQEHDVGEGKVFSSLMSQNLKNQIREKFGEEAYQNFVETSWADITGFVVREYTDMVIQRGTEQLTVEGARAAAQVYEDVKDSGAMEAAVQTLAEARDLAQAATAQALEAGKSVAEAMREGTTKMWEAVTGSEAVGESTAFVLQESEISAEEERQSEEDRRTKTVEEFRAAQQARKEAKAGREADHKKRHLEAVARFHQRRIERAEEKRAELTQSLPQKLDDEIVQDTVRKQELDAQLRTGAISETEFAVAVDQLMTQDKRDQILENLTEKGLRFGGALAEGFRGLKIKPQAATVGKIIGGVMGAARQTWVNRIVGADKTEILIKDARTWERVAATGRLQSVFTRVTETVVTQGDASRAFEVGKAMGTAAGQIGMASAGTASQQASTVLTFSKQAFDALSPQAKAQVTEALKDVIETGAIAASQVVGETLATAAGAALNNIDQVSTTYTTARNTLKYAANVMGAMGDHDQASWMGWLGDGMAHLVTDYTPDLVSLQNKYLGLGEVDLGRVVGEFMRDRYILQTGKTTAELAADAANKILFGTHVPDDQKSAAREALEGMLTTTFTTADAAGQYIYGTRDPSTGAPLIENPEPNT